MIADEHDVFIAFRDPFDRHTALTIADGLRALGFFVAAESLDPGQPAGPARVRAIEEAPDFVLVLSAETLAGIGDPDDVVRAEVAHALRHGRIVVPVCLPGITLPKADALPPDMRALANQPVVRFDPDRLRQSVALVAHSLSSDAEVEDRKLAKRARVAAWMVVTIFVGVVASFVVPAVYRTVTAPKPKPPLPPFSVSWAGVGQRSHDRRTEAFDVVEQTVVREGDRLKLIFSPSAKGFAYVVGRSASGEVSVLFPQQTIRGASAVDAGRVYDVPPGPAWLTVGIPGAPAELFLIASYDPLENLEELAEEPDPRTTLAERAELLASTVAGLMDGRHAAGVRYAKTRTGQSVDPRIESPAAAADARAILDDGAVVVRPLEAQRGAISVAVEIRLRAPQS
jgi:hypothetical protein